MSCLWFQDMTLVFNSLKGRNLQDWRVLPFSTQYIYYVSKGDHHYRDDHDRKFPTT